jgi:uncharacterized membrane protein
MTTTNRTLVWTLAALTVVLVLAPLLGMLGMSNAGGMMGGGMMVGMSVFGMLWLVLLVIVIAALVVLLIRETSKT